MMPATTEILLDQPAATRRQARRHWLPALVLLPFVLLMILFQLAPMVWVLVGSFQTPDGWGIDYYREILSSPFYLQSFTNSLRIAGIASLAGLAGSTKAIVFQLASLTDVHWAMSGEVVLMTRVGGIGTILRAGLGQQKAEEGQRAGALALEPHFAAVAVHHVAHAQR